MGGKGSAIMLGLLSFIFLAWLTGNHPLESRGKHFKNIFAIFTCSFIERNGCVEDPPESNLINATMAKNSLEMKYAGVHIGENHKPYLFYF